MFIIELDTNTYLKDNGDGSWKYVGRNEATKFNSFEDAKAYVIDQEIRFVAPNVGVVNV